MLRKSCVILAATAFIGFAGTMSAQAGGDLPLEPVDKWSGLSVWLGGGASQIDTSTWTKFKRDDELAKARCRSLIGPIIEPKLLGLCQQLLTSELQKEPPSQLIQFKDEHFSREVHTNGDNDWEWFGTAGIGYDRRLGGGIGNGFYLGIFADWDFYPDSDRNFRVIETATHHGKKYETFSAKGDLDIENIWSVGVKASAAIHNDFLVYLLLGYSEMSIEGDINVSAKDPFWWLKHKGGVASPTKVAYRVEDDLDGWTAGIGGKWMIRDNLSLGLEYRYFGDFGSASSSAFNKTHKAGGKGIDCISEDGKKLCTLADVHQRWIKESAKSILDFDDIHSVRAVLTLHMGTPHRAAPAPLK